DPITAGPSVFESLVRAMILLGPWSSDTVAIASPLPTPTVNNTVLPSGRSCGQLAGPDPLSGCGLPPATLTWARSASRVANTMRSSGPQLPPALTPETLQIRKGAPPFT